MKHAIPTVLALALSSAAASAQQFYSSSEEFAANLPGPSYTHTFDDIQTAGAVSSPYFVTGDHGIAWDVNATSGLWGFPGGQLTVDQSVDPIRFTFTGSDIYAFGGEFFGGDWDGAPDLADITITTSTGASQIFPNINIASFIGFISTNNEPLEWVEISVDGAGNRYATTTVAIAAIPEPATTAFIFGGLTLGAGIWWHRRLKTAQRK